MTALQAEISARQKVLNAQHELIFLDVMKIEGLLTEKGLKYYEELSKFVFDNIHLLD